MLNVNTIEFNGVKAVINSYSDHPALADDIVKGREWMAQLYPNAIVRTERMTTTETMALVAEGRAREPEGYRGGYSAAHEIGKASNS